MMSSPSASSLALRVLGALEIKIDSHLLTSRLLIKAQALLVYLAMTQQPQPRTTLMVLLWGDSSEEAARRSLRGVLTNLRAQLEPFLLIERQTVALRPDAKIWVDAVAFEQQVTQALALQDASQLEQAMAFYRGELFSGFHVRYAPDFERWLYAEQERLRQLAIRTLEALAISKTRASKWEEAIAHLRRVLTLEPWREETHRQLMEWLVRSGQRSAALVQYALCVQALGGELGVEPSPETTMLYQKIQQNIAGVEEAKHQETYADPKMMVEPATSLVGRQAEWQQLLLAWQRASQGQARMVVIAGEAGIGKTRLAQELANWVRRQGGRVAVAHCYAAEGAMTFTPVIELLRSEVIVRTLTELAEVWLAEVARLLPELLTQHPQLRVAEASGDSLQRQRFFEALARGVLGGQRPLMLMVDDLQWADRETLEWVHYLLRFAPQAHLLLVGTVRSEEVTVDHPLQPLLLNLRRERRLDQIALSSLNTDETGMLAIQLGGREFTSDEVTALYQQTDGNPLFIVETVRAQLERKDRASNHTISHGSVAHTLPEGIRAVIQGRLAQLSPLAQEIAQLAAVVGRAFSLELLASAGNYPEEELLQSLDELWQRHILQDLSGSGYDFSHTYTREVAYSQISPLRRRLLHRRAAQALEQLHSHELDAVSGFIAGHYELGDQPLPAIQYYQQAAHFANQAYAYHEAVEVLRKAFVLLPALRDVKERSRHELQLQMMLGHALMMAKSWTDPEAQQAYSRALELCSDIGADVHVYEAIWGLHEIYLFQGNYAKARAASEHCWRLAHQLGDTELILQAHHAFWALHFWYSAGSGGLRRALDHTQAGCKLYRPVWHSRHVHRFSGHDPGVCALCFAAKTQWLLGYPDQAVQSLQQAVTLATQLGHPFSLNTALIVGAKIHCYRREPTLVLHYLEQADLVALQSGLRSGGDDLTLSGWSQGQITPSGDAAVLVRQGIQNWRALQMKLEQPFMLALLAETYERAGQTDMAQQTVEEAIELVQSIGEEYWRPELYRLRGHFQLIANKVQLAEESCQQALSLARSQEAKSLELRAAIELSQIWEGRGRRAEAHALLYPIYTWFSEGFETADLRRAQALLHALAS